MGRGKGKGGGEERGQGGELLLVEEREGEAVVVV